MNILWDYRQFEHKYCLSVSLFTRFPVALVCDDVLLFIFLEKTKQKIVVVLESLRLQGHSQRQARVA